MPDHTQRICPRDSFKLLLSPLKKFLAALSSFWRIVLGVLIAVHLSTQTQTFKYALREIIVRNVYRGECIIKYTVTFYLYAETDFHFIASEVIHHHLSGLPNTFQFSKNTKCTKNRITLNWFTHSIMTENLWQVLWLESEYIFSF